MVHRITTFYILALIPALNYVVIIGLEALVLYLVGSLLFSIRTYSSRLIPKSKYVNFLWGQRAVGMLWKIIMISVILASLPIARTYVFDLWETALAAGGGSTLLGTLVGIWQYIKAQKSDDSSGTFSDIVIYLGAFALIYGILLMSYMIGWRLANEFILPDPVWNNLEDINWLPFLLMIVFCLFVGFFVNLNLVAPHRVWRDRLMEAYMPDKVAISENKWHPAEEANKASMSDMCSKPNSKRPYHLINTNIILVNSPQTKFRHRGGDNFIVSPLYSGSDSTDWQCTTDFQVSRFRTGISLATAMAASAAALNPNAGVSGEGITRNIAVSLLLSVLNLRLGYWTINPGKRKGQFL